RFASSDSQPVSINISPEDSATSLSGRYFYVGQTSYSILANGGTYPYGAIPAIDAQPLGVHSPAGSNDGLATGTIVFTDSASTGTISSPSVGINLNGIAEWLPDSPLVGSHSISASYSGDLSFHPSSTTAPLTFTITKVTPAADLHVNGDSVISLTDTASVTAQTGITTRGLRPMGSVKFFSGTKLLG